MPKLFAGFSCLLVGLTANQKRIFSQNIVSEGGVVVSSTAALFGPTEFNEAITHIFVENKNISYESLCKLANYKSIPQTIPVVNTSYIINCCHKKTLLPIESFLVTHSAPVEAALDSVDQDVSSASAGIQPNGNSIEGKQSTLLPQISASTLDWNQMSISTLEQKRSDFVPLIDRNINFGLYSLSAWHEEEGILFNFVPPTIIRSASSSFSEADGSKPHSSLLPVIAFDMDHTIVTTRSGNVHPRDNSDWQLWHRDVMNKLHSLPACNFDGQELFQTHILFVSNQGGIYKKKDGIKGFCSKIEKIRSAIGLPISFICATDVNNHFRKPLPGMWEFFKLFMEHHYDKFSGVVTASVGDSSSSLSSSQARPQFSAEMLLFVGDAAGRPAEGTRKKDFSDSDLKFAMNVGCPFQTPEKFFLNSTNPLHVAISCRGFRLSSMDSKGDPLPRILQENDLNANYPELILLVGPPATGKSTLAKKLEANGYHRVNQDTLKNFQKCILSAKNHLLDCKNSSLDKSEYVIRHWKGVVIDNTNTEGSTRKTWISLANELSVPIRAVCMDISIEVSSSLEKLRMLDPGNPDKRHIPGFVLQNFFKELKWPVESEGFSDITFIPFCPMAEELRTPAQRRLMNCYLG